MANEPLQSQSTTEAPRELPSGEPKPKRGFWATVKNHLLHPEKTAEEVALSFAIGFSIAWNPLLGLHTLMVLLICFCSKRLHRPLMLVAIFINNPWTMVPMATASTYAGNLMLGRGWKLDLSNIHWEQLGWRSFVTQDGLKSLGQGLKPILAPYFLGGVVLSLIALGLGYVVMRWIAIRLRRIHFPHLHVPHRSSAHE